MSAPITLPGTYNGWDPADVAWRPASTDAERYELTRVLPRGRHAFKLVPGEDWAQALGCRGSEPLIPPTGGALVRGGHDVVLNLPIETELRFTLDLRGRRWAVDPVHPWPRVDNAVWPGSLRQGAFGERLGALRAGAEGKPFGYAWDRWDRLRPVLEQGSFHGFFPIHEDHRVLFVYNGHLDGDLYLGGTFNGWGGDRFDRLPGTDVHLLYRELDPGVQHFYKLQHNGGWFRDPLNRWVIPDGMPIPMFQPGAFNSVLDLGGPPNERGDNLLWIRDFYSAARDNSRDLFVWLPRGYAWGDRRYPVMYVQDGNESVTRAWMHAAARHAVESGEVEPVILVFVALARQDERGYEYGHLDGRGAYADFLCREVVPFVDANFRTIAEPSQRAVAGASYGGAIAYYVAWRHPELFGKVAGQGTSFHVNEWDVLRLYAESPRRELQLYIDSARATAPGMPRDNEWSGRYAERVLRRAGYALRHVRRDNQRHDWSSWNERFPEILRTFWPALRR